MYFSAFPCSRFFLEVGMKKMAAGVSCLVFLFCASVCSAAYLIHLKDGRDIVTHEYWEEGSQIKIKQYDGVVGIPKADVSSIEETDEVRTTVIKSEPEKETEKEGEGTEVSKQKEGKEEGEKRPNDVKKEKASEIPDGEKKQIEKNAFLKEFDALKKRFENVENMTKEEIFQFDKELADLRNKILHAGLGGTYADLLVTLSEMGNRAEEVYKRRSQ